MMADAVYDSRAWTGEVPDYRAMIRRALRLDCQRELYTITVHWHGALTAAERAAIVAACDAASLRTPTQPEGCSHG